MSTTEKDFVYNVVMSDRTLTVIVNGLPHHVERDHPRIDEIMEALRDPETTDAKILALMAPAHAVAIATANSATIRVDGGRLFYGNEEVHNALADRVAAILAENGDVSAWVKFAENVYANPADYSRDELYLWLEKSDLPITEDGNFLAYKNVRADYKDIHSGKFDNSVGQVVFMERSEVDPVRDRTCSVGLHFCSKSYLRHYNHAYGGHTMIVKINPADVVSIPSDYNNAKGRCWRYEVVGEIPIDTIEKFKWPAVVPEEGHPTLEDWDDYPVEDAEPEVDETIPEEDRGRPDAPDSTVKRFGRWLFRGGK